MDNSNISKDRHSDHLGVNKMGKNIKKSPLHQPSFNNSNNNNNNTARQHPQPQVYNISKNDFRNVVQQLTGSPSRSQEPLPRPAQNPPKPSSMRLQKIRPPPLTPFNRPHIPQPAPAPGPIPAPAPIPAPYNSISRPQYGQPSPTRPSLVHGDSFWGNAAESPISAYMRYLQSSIVDSSPRQTHLAQHQHQPPPQHHSHPQAAGQFQAQPQSSALFPTPPMPLLPSPRTSGPGLLPSPTSQFLLPSPTGFLNMPSPRSSFPLLSPGYQFPPPLTPNFSFSPIGQPGILGPGPQLPPSPGAFFPLSPSGLFPSPNPMWRDR